MAYITIREYGEDEFIEKKSQFIGYAKRCENEEEAKAFVAEIKSMHKQATHNCWAYVVGKNMGIQRYSDDGEPQGTAGIPILEVMKKSNVTDCAIVVTRYFGGIMLGAGGLTRAYTKGASIALKYLVTTMVQSVTLLFFITSKIGIPAVPCGSPSSLYL